MPELDRIYDRAFFNEWGAKNSEYVESARVIVDHLHSAFKPGSVADVGCGCGLYSHFFKEKGARVLSLDGVLPPEDQAFPVDIALRDLTEPFKNVWGEFDMALCLEVAEHIPPEFSDVFLGNLIQFSDTLVLSCAPPNQGGHHHVNEQPKRYWVEKLARMGFSYNRPRTGGLQEAFKRNRPTLMWMAHSICVYERVKSLETAERNLPFRVRL